jgi:hypothetical protein
MVQFDGIVCNMALMDVDDLDAAMTTPDQGYAAEGWWTTHGDGVRGRVGANHRMLTTYLTATLRAGFEFEEFGESPAPVPRFFIARCRRRS